MIASLGIVFYVIVRMAQFIKFVNCLIRFEACLFHKMKVINVDNGLNAEELLWKLAMKRIKDHLKNILLTAALGKAIFVPNLCHKVAEDFTL